MSDALFVRFSRVVALATAIVTGVFFFVPFLAIITGAYPRMAMDLWDVSRLLLLFLPEALAVALPITVPIAVFLVYRRAPFTRRVLASVAALTVAAAFATGVLSVWVAPVTNAAYRKLAFGDAGGRIVDDRRLNEPGGPGDRSQMRGQSGLPASMLVFAVVAMVAARVTHRQPRQ